MEEKHLIELINVSKEYSGTVVLDHINLYVRDGEFLTLLGPSGCGKTTMLRLIAGFEAPTSGQIQMEGVDIASIPPYKRKVNTVFQKYALFPHLNVFENIAFGLKIKKTEKAVIEEKVNSMLELVNLKGYGKRNIDQLSGGQQQRVAIARALVNEPKVLLLDEPLAALDLKLRQEMQLELKKMQQKLGITFIFVTHDQTEALTMSDTIVVMKDGEIQQIGKPTDIYNEPKNPFVADFIGESNIIPGRMIQDYKVRFHGLPYNCVDAGFKRNEEVDVVVRPEDVDIISPENARVTGIVQSVIFMGVHYEIEVDCNGYDWVVHTTDYVKVGETVGISLEPDAIHVMHKTRSMNIFDAIAHPADNLVTVDEVDFSASIPDGINEKDPIVVEIYPKDVVLTAPQDERSIITGYAKGCMFLGTHYEVTIDCGENDWIAFSDDYIEDGEEVGIFVDKDAITVTMEDS